MISNETLKKLCEEFPQNTADLELLQHYLMLVEDQVTHELMGENLEKAQQIVNRLYSLNPVDELIDVQVEVNILRNKYDITDPREIVHVDNGRGFVQ